MSAKQDRQGVRTASDLEQKYNFDKTFAELMGIATDARNKVDSVESTLRNEMKEQYTSISRDTEKIVMEALEEYVKTGDLEEYKQTLQSQFKIMADQISATASSTEEQVSEVRDYLDEQVSILDKYMKESEAALIVRADKISAKVDSNEQRIIEVTDTVTGQVTAFEEYKSTNSSALEVLDNKISANLQSTEELIREVKDDLGEQTELLEQYKQSTESDFSVMNEQISMNLSSTMEQITSVQSGLDGISDNLADQARQVETLREEKDSELKLLTDRMEVNFESTTEQISNVNGEVQAVVEELEKHFEFSTDGLIIKAGENSMELHLDNDLIRFTRNGQEFGWWDGVDFYTGNVVVAVSERAQFGNFAFVPRSNGSLDFLKVDEYTALAITSHPQNKTVTGTYQSASFSVTATGDGLTYQWQTSTDGETWTNMANGTSSSINVMYTTTDIKKRYYRCVVTDKRRKKVTSNVATFTLNA